MLQAQGQNRATPVIFPHRDKEKPALVVLMVKLTLVIALRPHVSLYDVVPTASGRMRTANSA